MPAMHYQLRWPDGSDSLCYSPSLIIRDHFQVGQRYPLNTFLQSIRNATDIAEQRVLAKYGFVCSRASDQLVEIESLAASFVDKPEAEVLVLAFEDIV